MANVIAVILGGGRGTRLFPLTKERAKPSVPIAGKFRLIDIPMSNCIHSGMEEIYILTQFNSTSLNHHVAATYQFGNLTTREVRVLAAQQTPTSENWYQGTADAVRQNLVHLLGDHRRPDHIVILAGDHLYRMSYMEMIEAHIDAGADITLGVVPISPAETAQLGVLKLGEGSRITKFVEKPETEEEYAGFQTPRAWWSGKAEDADEDCLLGSMGIYVFRTDVLVEAMKDSSNDDFGADIIPKSIANCRVHAFPFAGYWADIGTIRSFYTANLGLLETVPSFDFYNETAPIYTFRYPLPNTKVNESSIRQSMLAEGSILDRSEINRSIIGLRTIVRGGSRIDASLLMGADYYESAAEIAENAEKGIPPLGIGHGCTISGAIIDKNARIGDGSVLVNDGQIENLDSDEYHIRDRIIVVPKNGSVRPGTVI